MADNITNASNHLKRYVLVYGTLRRGEQRDINSLLPTPLFKGYGKTPGMLYHLGDYPGVRLGGSQFVHGEVYQICPELERQLDEIEEVWPQQTGEYTRQHVGVTFTDASAASSATPNLTCLVYEVASKRIAGMPVIATGDWLQRST